MHSKIHTKPHRVVNSCWEFVFLVTGVKQEGFLTVLSYTLD